MLRTRPQSESSLVANPATRETAIVLMKTCVRLAGEPPAGATLLWLVCSLLQDSPTCTPYRLAAPSSGIERALLRKAKDGERDDK